MAVREIGYQKTTVADDHLSLSRLDQRWSVAIAGRRSRYRSLRNAFCPLTAQAVESSILQMFPADYRHPEQLPRRAP